MTTTRRADVNRRFLASPFSAAKSLDIPKSAFRIAQIDSEGNGEARGLSLVAADPGVLGSRRQHTMQKSKDPKEAAIPDAVDLIRGKV
jgi:hypothetical protein